MHFHANSTLCVRAASPAMSAQPTDPAARVVNEADRESNRWETHKEALRTFYKAPCLVQSLGLGTAGGLGLGALRWMNSRDVRAAGTWGAVAAGLLSCSSWYVCRRAMYDSMNEETVLLQEAVNAVQQGDKERQQQALDKLAMCRAKKEAREAG